MLSLRSEVRRSTRSRKGLALVFAPFIFSLAANAVPVTISASPANGPAFTVAGSGCQPGQYTTPQTLQWTPGASCNVAFITPYTKQGTRYVFAGWQDGSSASATRVLSTPAQATTYTAVFSTQYYVSLNLIPQSSGAISGGGGWIPASSVVNLTATAAPGYRFVYWSGVDTSATYRSAMITVNSARSVTANFAAETSFMPSTYVALLVSSGSTAKINDYGQILAGTKLWTPASANGFEGSVTSLPFTGIDINGHGQILANVSSKAVLWTPRSVSGID